jgi:hypothetical protein
MHELFPGRRSSEPVRPDVIPKPPRVGDRGWCIEWGVNSPKFLRKIADPTQPGSSPARPTH